MLTKRIIPCMDIQNGKIVKGINFLNIREVGDPVVQGRYYAEQGADELVYLDITATNEERKVFVTLVREIAQAINIPFTVGGGISGIDDVSRLLDAGADKISINSAAVKNPKLITELANRFGSQCIVVAIDTKNEEGGWNVYVQGGKTRTPLKTTDWAKQAEELGAGEILLTSMNNDGTKNGFALDITKSISQSLNIPIIASGGAGTMRHFADVFTGGKADAALAASVFHYKEIEIPVLKQFLLTHNVPVRIQ
jgi:imidazole glycerol-phosphate synthase subunit HisF